MVQLDGALDLVRLQRADKMQPHVRRTLEQGGPFGFRFLDPVLAKQTVSGSDGIGKAAALSMAKEGANVVIVARRPEVLDQAVQDFPLIEADDRAIGDTPFFNDWVLNQNDNKYWQKIDGVNRTHTLQVPILLMAGWFDPFLPTQIEDFNQVIHNANDNVATETRLIIGPWGHANEVTLPGSQQSLPYRPASLAPSIPWFDYNLGIGKDKFDLPKVKIFVLGHNQ